MADTSPGSDSGIKGELSKGFVECTDIPDERANQGDSDVLRLKGKIGPRDIDVPKDDPERDDWQFGNVKRLEKP